jgi:hypothetical protein
MFQRSFAAQARDPKIARLAVEKVEKVKYAREWTRPLAEAYLLYPSTELWLEIGHCNLKCSHCFGNFGPHKEYISPNLVGIALSQIKDTHIGKICLGDGEPFSDFDKMLKILDLIDGMPTSIDTNACFGSTYDDARDALETMRKHGFTIRPQKHRTLGGLLNSWIGVSADMLHGIDYMKNAVNIVRAYNDVFADEYQGLESQMIRVNYTVPKRTVTRKDMDNDAVLRDNIIIPLWNHFGGKFFSSYANTPFTHFYMIRSDKGDVRVTYSTIIPVGRGEKASKSRKRQIKSEEITFSADKDANLSLRADGSVCVGHGQCCFDGRYLANIRDVELPDMIDWMIDDPLWQSKRLYDIGGIVAIMDQVGMPIEFSAVDGGCSLCRAVMSSPEFVEEIRQKFAPIAAQHKDIISYFLGK